jgi:hypothetical protein
MPKRTTVYLNDDLSERIQAVKSEINVSEVAAAALEKAVRNIEATKEADMDLQQAVTRLRASRSASVGSDLRRGYEHGWEWAKDRAEYDELLAFLETVKWADSDDGWSLISLPVREEPDWRVLEDEGVAGGPYKKGFCDAVAEFWGRVKDLID